MVQAARTGVFEVGDRTVGDRRLRRDRAGAAARLAGFELGLAGPRRRGWGATRSGPPARRRAGVELDELLSVSDGSQFSAPLELTCGADEARRLAAPPPTCAVLVRGRARGGRRHEPEIRPAPALRLLKGAALDVFEREPLPPDLHIRPARWCTKWVLLSPHLAGSTNEARERGDRDHVAQPRRRP